VTCKIMLTIILASLILGCSATIKHVPIKDDDADKSADGIRYYQASPYLLVYSNSKGGLKWEILYLPDQTKKMTVTPKVTGGRSEVALFFKNGVFTGSTVLGDTTELPKAVIAAVQSAIPLLTTLLLAPIEEERPKVPAPYLYRIIVKGKEVIFIGEKGSVDIIVPIPEKETIP